MKHFIIILLFILSSFKSKSQNLLLNTNWNVISLYEKMNDTLISNNSQFPEPCGLNFKVNTVKVSTCNGYSLSYSIKKDQLIFSNYPPGLQTAYCGNGFSNTIEEFIFKKIGIDPVTIVVKSDTLTLTTHDFDILTCVKRK